ncbi:MAG: hypothetical protein A2V70_02070 [Planctomycetes bacterium RBG_13_63_9]|nr:MAG: hypothetical protein A2V70_02070 [Planctomycetes bacterium RBG_13_63_9]
MQKTTHATWCLTPILFCIFMAGCGSGNDLASVQGKVTLNGRPLEGATVKFQPTAPEGSSSSGMTDADGRYELMYTFSTSGAMPGEHIVSIGTAGTSADDEGCEVEREERVPAKYNTQTELKRMVVPGSNTIDFEL